MRANSFRLVGSILVALIIWFLSSSLIPSRLSVAAGGDRHESANPNIHFGSHRLVVRGCLPCEGLELQPPHRNRQFRFFIYDAWCYLHSGSHPVVCILSFATVCLIESGGPKISHPTFRMLRIPTMGTLISAIDAIKCLVGSAWAM